MCGAMVRHTGHIRYRYPSIQVQGACVHAHPPYVHMCVHTYIYPPMHCGCMYTCLYARVCVCRYTHKRIHIIRTICVHRGYIYIYIYMHVCVYRGAGARVWGRGPRYVNIIGMQICIFAGMSMHRCVRTQAHRYGGILATQILN